MGMSEQARKAKNAYAREWNKKNREKVRQYYNRYWEKKAADCVKPEQQARQLRALGYSQRQIAERLGLSLGTVNKLLRQ